MEKEFWEKRHIKYSKIFILVHCILFAPKWSFVNFELFKTPKLTKYMTQPFGKLVMTMVDINEKLQE
jgi:hypothetical protein